MRKKLFQTANIEQWEAGMDVAFYEADKLRTVGGGFRREICYGADSNLAE